MNQDSNPLIRFLDDQTVERLKEIKDTQIANDKAKNTLRDTLLNASTRINELLSQLV